MVSNKHPVSIFVRAIRLMAYCVITGLPVLVLTGSFSLWAAVCMVVMVFAVAKTA